MSFDLAGALRRLKPQQAAGRISRRADADLPFLLEPVEPGPELLLDTCVYIDVLQACSPPAADRLLNLRIVNHSTVALSELTHLFGRLDPAHPMTRRTLVELTGVINDIPAHRLSRPSERAAGEAGILAGLVARLNGRPAGAELLNDALLLLQAAETGCTLLTRNLADFDLLLQLWPQASVLFYRRE